MNKRIAEIRKSAGLSQQKFADRIGLTKNFISLIETGNRVPSDRTIADICREFYVNETWLRTGAGKIHRDMDRAEEIEFLIKGESDDFRRRLVAVLSKLDVSEWQLLEKMALKLAADAEAERAPQKLHVIKIAGRDGSFREETLTDDELVELESRLDQLPDATGDL